MNMNQKQTGMSVARLKESYFEFILILLLDFVAVVVVYMIPTVSHLVSLPLYRFEPMRWILLLNLWFVGDKRNAYIMAFTLPLFSFFVGSHPVFVKAIIMAVELVANVFFFLKLSRWLNNCLAMFISIVASKLFYYAIKYVCITTGLMASSMVSTSIWIQLLVAVAISLAFLFFSKPISKGRV